ncbi:MAG: NitT/TauT family transport system ATP-binding protein [Candidatus Azotimanducaceae bacterium]|jgi:NitT/TauT family transport system ATP-binding protein
MEGQNALQIVWHLMSTDAAFFSVNGVSYAFADGTKVLSNVDWHIPVGAFHCLVGRSGCGKTTLLKLVAGLLLPTNGLIRIQEQAVHGPSPKVGFVFQTPALLEWLSVIDNVLLPISLHRPVLAEDRATARELLELVGIADLAGRYPAQLSGGQQSRTSLARALVTSPQALLMDEPFAALDAITREELQEDLLHLVALRQTTVLFVTHDIAEAVYLGDHVAMMDRGRISPATLIEMPRPRDAGCRYAKQFVDSCQNIRAAMTLQVGNAA